MGFVSVEVGCSLSMECMGYLSFLSKSWKLGGNWETWSLCCCQSIRTHAMVCLPFVAGTAISEVHYAEPTLTIRSSPP